MMNKGKKIAIGTMHEIKKMCGGIEYEIEFNVKEHFDFDVVKNNGNFIARTKNLDEFNRITGWVAGHNGKIINIKNPGNLA